MLVFDKKVLLSIGSHETAFGFDKHLTNFKVRRIGSCPLGFDVLNLVLFIGERDTLFRQGITHTFL